MSLPVPADPERPINPARFATIVFALPAQIIGEAIRHVGSVSRERAVPIARGRR
jgi:hypothetical protein